MSIGLSFLPTVLSASIWIDIISMPLCQMFRWKDLPMSVCLGSFSGQVEMR
jgi:hypothetical protein